MRRWLLTLLMRRAVNIKNRFAAAAHELAFKVRMHAELEQCERRGLGWVLKMMICMHWKQIEGIGTIDAIRMM